MSVQESLGKSAERMTEKTLRKDTAPLDNPVKLQISTKGSVWGYPTF